MEDIDPIERLWIVALAMEDNGGPPSFIEALRDLAQRLDDLSAPSEAADF